MSHVVGIYKIAGFFLSGALWDVALILAVLWHRHQLKMKGYWDLTPDRQVLVSLVSLLLYASLISKLFGQ